MPTESDAEDLVSVREAAQATGVTRQVIQSSIACGQLAASPHPHGLRVSLRAVRILAVARTAVPVPVTTPSPDPLPPDARLILAVASEVGISRAILYYWVKRGRLPSWPSRHGRLVRLADVQAVVKERGVIARF